MKISHSSHHHELVLKYAICPYYCPGCDQLGFGLSYVCSNDCNFFLHKQCGKPETQIRYPFSDKCVLTFRNGGSGVDSTCDACGKKIKGLHYRCTCTFRKRNLHPNCIGYERTLEPAYGLTMHLQKTAASKCLHCQTKDLSHRVPGWAYVSSCGTYSYHVSCVNEIINTNWKNGFFNGKSDPFLAIKQKFPEDKDRMHHLVVAQKNKKIKKYATAALKIIFNALTHNHLGHVGAAQSFFSR
ncbi:hypothetical protein L1987_20593 [Smallanthus sonchifolius]|uniref:Uncharacterized protein n=1 Tax=Smallanthus sonchifolius TaxID=185202 RepID=A0ACB9IV39_9ASTR|nr:hypothetical protein L1987_20593 [Smallanthus sonchifolius]